MKKATKKAKGGAFARHFFKAVERRLATSVGIGFVGLVVSIFGALGDVGNALAQESDSANVAPETQSSTIPPTFAPAPNDSPTNDASTANDSTTNVPTTNNATSAPPANGDDGVAWRNPSNDGSATLDPTNSNTFVGPKKARFALGLDKLPNEAGQFWVLYNLSPYSDRFPNIANPQTAIVDWIMFDAGDDFWRKDPFSVFSTTRDRMYVYHTANVQRYVSNVVDRFLDETKRNATFSIKVVALQSPDWRVRVASSLTPTSTSVLGDGVDVQGWLLEKAQFDKVFSEVEKRSDYLILNADRNDVPNGERFGWLANPQAKSYVRDVRLDSNADSGYSTDEKKVDEGFRIEATPLLSTNGEMLETIVRYRSTVVEKMKSFGMRVPTSTSPRRQLTVEKPSIVSCDVRVKIAFDRTKAAIVDLGMVPMTLQNNKSDSNGIVGNISKFVAPQSAFYDVLVFIEER